LVVLLAQPIALYWIKTKDLPVATVQKAVMLMGAVFAVQFPASIYSGVLIGTDRQIANAVAALIFTTLKVAGVIAVLKFVSPTIESYFIWQVLITLISTYCLRFLVWNNFKVVLEKAQFSVVQLQTIWRFAAGMTGISLVTFFLSQIDKIVVSKFVLLEFVGYYNLAFLVSTGITQVISPMQPIIFPKFTALVAENKQLELVALYHKSARWIAIVVFPIGFTLILFAKEILFLWTKNPTLADNTAPIVRVVAAGTICNCMMWVPYWYMLAKGITKFTIYQNIIASIIFVPLLFWWTGTYGALGASFVWLAVNVGYVLISIPLFHHLYLKRELINFYTQNLLKPLLTTVILSSIFKSFQVLYFPLIEIFPLIILLLSSTIIYALVIPEIRTYFINLINQ
jgi:O-antigen/teichoic acid export membrane protein